MSTIRVDNLQTAGGAGLYLGKAWVNFNGTGTVAIREDGNVSSITDNGTGQYTASYSNSIADANYALTGGTVHQDNFNGNVNVVSIPDSYTPLSGSTQIKVLYGNYASGGPTDQEYVFVTITR